MEIKDLIQLGFNKNEAKVYVALIKFGKASASEIIKETKFHKNIIYDNLSKLIDKGLVTYIIKEKRKVFKLAPSNRLIGLFEEREKEILEKKKIATQFSKQIDSMMKKKPIEQEATIYKGISAIKSFYKETLKGNDYVVFGAPKESINIMGAYFWENYTKKRIESKIKVKLIFNESLRNFAEKLFNKLTDIRFLDKEFEPRTETHIQGNKVAMIVWSEQPVLFLISDKIVADDYRIYFKNMWRKAKK